MGCVVVVLFVDEGWRISFLGIDHFSLDLICFTKVVRQTWSTVIVGGVTTKSGKEDYLAINVCCTRVTIGRSSWVRVRCSWIVNAGSVWMTKSGGIVIIIRGFSNWGQLTRWWETASSPLFLVGRCGRRGRGYR